MSKVIETGLSFCCFVSLDWLEFALGHRISYSNGSQRHNAMFRSVQNDTQRVSCSHWKKINGLKLLPLLYMCVETRKPFLAFNLFLVML